jgi:hypothetical protein
MTVISHNEINTVHAVYSPHVFWFAAAADRAQPARRSRVFQAAPSDRAPTHFGLAIGHGLGDFAIGQRIFAPQLIFAAPEFPAQPACSIE